MNLRENQDSDAPIRATDSDASLARLSAVQKGYIKDDYVQHFVPRARFQSARPPLINIGTYLRSEGIDKLVDAWSAICAAEGRSYQIVSLGAGSDSRFWRFNNERNRSQMTKYIEMDFAEITSKKAMAIKKNKELMKALGEEVTLGDGGASLHSPVYHLLPIDLRSEPSSTFPQLLALIDCNKPTLLLFECVLAYMQPSESSAVFSWFADVYRGKAPLSAIVYEMFGLNDSFGQVMKTNLKMRGVELPGVEPYTSLSSLRQRFTEHGFALAKALTLKEIKLTRLPEHELQRIMTIERLDEVEELDLVLHHYAISWGVLLPDAPAEDWVLWDMRWGD